MTSSRKTRICRSFDNAAHYDRYGGVQREVAAALLERLLPLARGGGPLCGPSARLWEIGCGTGFLSAGLRAGFPEGTLLLSDIAPSMVERCRARLAAAGDGESGTTVFAVIDGEAPPFTVPSGAVSERIPDRGEGVRFDLITASMTFQWFAALPAALGRLRGLLRPGGQLVFAMPGAASFAEWRTACAGAHVPCGIPPYPDATALAAFLGDEGRVESRVFSQAYENGQDFLHHLGGIGARVPAPGHRPSPAGLRRVLRYLGDGPFRVSHEILFAESRAPLSPAPRAMMAEQVR